MRKGKLIGVLSIVLAFVVFASTNTIASGIVVPEAPKSNDKAAWEEAYQKYLDSAEQTKNKQTPSPSIAPSPTPIVVKEQEPISDIKGHWATSAILHCYDMGIIRLFEGDKVLPNEPIKRAEFAYAMNEWMSKNAALLTELGYVEKKEKVSTNDIADSMLYYSAMKSQLEKGLMTTSGGAFKPNSNLTRETACEVWINLMKQLTNCVIDQEYFNALSIDKALNKYIDKNSISYQASEAVAAMTNIKLVSGYSNNTFRPNGTISRAEIYTIITNAEYFLKKAIKGPQPTPIPEMDKIKLSKLSIAYANQVGYGLYFTVNDSAFKQDASIVIATTFSEYLKVDQDNIQTTGKGLTSNTYKLSELERYRISPNDNIFTRNMEGNAPNTYYIYVMLKYKDQTTDILSTSITLSY